jgi:hypothetical protein
MHRVDAYLCVEGGVSCHVAHKLLFGQLIGSGRPVSAHKQRLDLVHPLLLHSTNKNNNNDNYNNNNNNNKNHNKEEL